MEFTSILEPGNGQEKKSARLPAFFADLNLDRIVQLIQEQAGGYDITNMFYYFPDEEGAAYRRDIYQDMKNPLIFTGFEEFSDAMRKSAHLESHHAAKDNEMQGCIWKLEAIYYYCKAVSRLHEALKETSSRGQLSSRGLRLLYEYLCRLVQNDRFAGMQKKVCDIWDKVRGFRFVLSIQGNRLVLKEDTKEGLYDQFMKECFQEYNAADKEGLSSPYQTDLYLSGLEQRLLAAFFAKNASLLKEIKGFVNEYAGYKEAVLCCLEGEVQFYLAYYRFQRKCVSQGFAFSCPECCPDKPMQGEGVYDLALACVNYLEDKEVISNDFIFNREERFFVVNGPNQGGKTTFARSLGQLVFFAKLGLDVNARTANVHYFTDLLTHFSVEESMESGQGKLMEELNRLAPVMKQQCRGAFVIINELFTTAAHYDGCIMGARVLEHFIKYECCGVYVTHLRELGNACTGVVRMTAMLDGTKEHRRTYRVMRNSDCTGGYAEDIVNKHQLSYESLRERLKNCEWQKGGQEVC